MTNEFTLNEDTPDIPWIQVYSGLVDNPGCHVMNTTDGGLVLAHTNNDNGRIIRVQSNGSVLWYQEFGLSVNVEVEALVACEDGGYATVGRSLGEGHNGAGFLWLVRIAENGTILWEREYVGYDWGVDLKECQDGGFIIAASYPDIIRVDANGNVMWNYTSSWYRCHPNSVVVCPDDGFAITGGMALADSYYDAFIIRIDDEGKELWNKIYNYASLDVGHSLIQCNDGGFAIAGESGSYNYYPRDFWLLRTDENGIALWDGSYCVGFANSIVECPDGGFALVGTYNPNDAYSEWDGIFVRTDSDGNRLWINLCSGPSEDRAHDIILYQDGEYAVTGWTDTDTGRFSFLWRLSDDANDNMTIGTTTTITTTTTTITTTNSTPTLTTTNQTGTSIPNSLLGYDLLFITFIVTTGGIMIVIIVCMVGRRDSGPKYGY